MTENMIVTPRALPLDRGPFNASSAQAERNPGGPVNGPVSGDAGDYDALGRKHQYHDDTTMGTPSPTAS
jgi:hypothetical protein